MKVIVTSDLTIFEELRTLGEKRGFVVEKHLALNIKTKADINKDELEYVKTVNNMIFQSKNAVKYSERLHNEIQKNKEAKMYCLGKYTKTELKKYLAGGRCLLEPLLNQRCLLHCMIVFYFLF